MTAPRPEEADAVAPLASLLDSALPTPKTKDSTATSSDNNNNHNHNNNNIRVVVRIRPSSDDEDHKETPVVTSMNALLLGETTQASSVSSSSPELVQVTTVVNGARNSSSSAGSSPHNNTDSNNNNNNDTKRWFELDAVLDPNSTQADVYERSGARHAVQHSLWQGYNCTLLAYGQSGAGKTFTMMGNTTNSDAAEKEHGLIPRACHDLFQQIETQCQGQAQVEFSFLEIYNETLRDLLAAPVPTSEMKNNNNNNNSNLQIRENSRTGEVSVAGLTAQRVTSPHDIHQLLHEASQRRVVGSTALNAVSSRSHALCILHIRGTTTVHNNSNGGRPQQFQSKLTLVDLAGSERLKKTGALGNRQKEGININKSLLVLGQVVAALSEQQQQSRGSSSNHQRRKPPYRDSKLTRLLQDSLGGNSRTILVACVSPDACHVEESINTLRYATAARNICNTVTRNVTNNTLSPAQVMRLQRDHERLQQQVLELQAAVQTLEQQQQQQQRIMSSVSSTVSFDSSSDEDKKLPSLHMDDGSSEALTDDITVPSSQSSSSSSSQQIHPQTSDLLEPPNESYDDNNDDDDVDILRELIDLKTENCELRAELDEVRADAAASKRAAVQLSNVMDQLQQWQGEQVMQKRLEYRHLQKEEKWVQFLSDMLDTRCEEMGKLADDFDLVVRVVESCPDVTVVPPTPAANDASTVSLSPSTTTTPSNLVEGRSRRWLSQVAMNLSSHNGRTSGGGANTNPRLSALPAEDQELRQQLLRQHVDFFKMQMDEIVHCIRVEAQSLLQIRMSLRRDRERLENEIGSSEFVKDSLDSADGQLLQQLTTLLIGPVREV